MKSDKEINCPICKGDNLKFIRRLDDSPAMTNKIHNSLQSALKEEKAIINIYGCEKCNFVFNADFDSKKTDYCSNYDNSQDNSAYFSKYLVELARRLIRKYNLKNKTVAEVGCGKGKFLKLLYDLGVKKIRGFDPSYVDYSPEIDKLVTKKFFNVKNVKEKIDFIICRHVLEHIPNLDEFMSQISKCLIDGGAMYFEFPDLKWIIKNKVFFDFTYEHCNYFTENSVIALFNKFGFQNIIFDYGLKGQYFQLEISRFSIGKKPKKAFLNVKFDKISNLLSGEIRLYKRKINELDNLVIWGAAGKGVTFLNRLNISSQKCKYAIDINPNKQGKFIPITGQKIVSPEILRKEKNISHIIIMNQIYYNEISKQLRNLGRKFNLIKI